MILKEDLSHISLSHLPIHSYPQHGVVFFLGVVGVRGGVVGDGAAWMRCSWQTDRPRQQRLCLPLRLSKSGGKSLPFD